MFEARFELRQEFKMNTASKNCKVLGSNYYFEIEQIDRQFIWLKNYRIISISSRL